MGIINKPLNADEKAQCEQLFKQGKTYKEIGLLIGRSRIVVSNHLKPLGLKRSTEELNELMAGSPYDDPAIVEHVKKFRAERSLPELSDELKIPISSLHRLCERHNIAVPENYAKLQSERMKAAWTEEKRRLTVEKSKAASTAEVRKRLSEKSKAFWSDPENRSKNAAIQRDYWNKPENKVRLAEFRANQSCKLSSIQRTLYDILEDLNIPYKPEVIVGPYNFDCQAGKFLIECQGDYWHSLEKAIRVDKAKQTYIHSYHSDKYELKYLWEHEFHTKDKVIETVKHWFGISKLAVLDFDFKDLTIKLATAEEYRPLLSKYHYLPNAGRGGRAYGAYLDGQIVATCVFSPLVRHNIDTVEFSVDQSIELSRLCIHPKYQKKNFASWFVSRCMKALDARFKFIISYCDATFNHDGATYKALNFTQDKVIRPDYWYSDPDGWVMHKKTLYNRAIKMGVTEAVYAEHAGMIKVFGCEKMRFVYRR